MKKALVAIAFAGLASTASAAVVNSPHDLSNSSASPWKSLNGQLSACQFCHAPHNVNTGVPGAPLWNRNTVTSVTYNMYTSATLRNPGRRDNTQGPNANSATCLSCHDGSSDLGATYTGGRGFIGAVQITNAAFPTAANIGTDLTNDHPVSVRFVGGGNYNTTAAVTTAGIRLYNYAVGTDYVECGSCHDPHNYSVSADLTPFLRVGKSVICTTCHLY